MEEIDSPEIPDGSVALVDGLLVIPRRWTWAEKLLGMPLARINTHTHCPEAARSGRLGLVNGRWQE